MRRSRVPNNSIKSRGVMQSAPCQKCPDRYVFVSKDGNAVSCHSSCEKYSEYRQRLYRDAGKRFVAYAHEIQQENYRRESVGRAKRR